MSKPWPTLTTDEEAERFVAEADLSEYDFSVGKRVRFVLSTPKDTTASRSPCPRTIWPRPRVRPRRRIPRWTTIWANWSTRRCAGRRRERPHRRRPRRGGLRPAHQGPSGASSDAVDGVRR